MRKNLLSVTVEDITDGVSRIEKELVYYAKIVDLTIFTKAIKYEDHEQWEVNISKVDSNLAQGRIRVRKVTSDKTVYIQTIKSKVVNGDIETSFEVSDDAFEQMKSLSSAGMIKRRYVLPTDVNGLFFEVDCFFSDSEKTMIYPWVKIDLELQPDLEYKVLPQLPPEFTSVIINQKNDRTENEKKFIQNLYDKYFFAKHNQD